MYYYFYKITNKVNNKKYLGVHKTDNLNDGYMGSGTVLSKAKEKYGIENFNKEILKYFNNEDEMFAYEAEIVDETIVNDQSYYNVALGGHGGNLGKIVNEKRAKLFKGENNPMYGKHLSEEARKKMSDAKKGTHHTEETRKKISEKMKSKTRSEKTRKQISESMKGEKHPSAKRCIVNGIVYGCKKDAADAVGIPYSSFCYKYNKGFYS